MYGKMGYQVSKATQNSFALLSNAIENISNINSIGYKKGKSSFVETLNGEIAKYETRDFSQGPLRKTGGLFDMALDGPGFFEVELPNGQRAYSRVGRFKLTGEGELVTDEGYRVIPEVEPAKPVIESNNSKNNELGLNIKVNTAKLTIPTELVPEVQEDGTVNGINTVTGEKTKIGKINVVAFNNPQGLEAIGRGFYLPTDASGSALETDVGPDSATNVKQGYVEFGNVDIAAEFINITQIKNLLSAQIRLLKTIDKIYENVHYTISKSV
ncbi:MAG: flagellar hook basal-body protein [Candidatus Melainabacteria bacterium]|nr:flagellar hook basal-body protein [Candidatus Melainabacteria bacterium]